VAGNFFTSADARKLVNGGKLPIFISSTCLNGYFIEPEGECIGEALLRAEWGGAVAAWMSTGVSDLPARWN